MPDVRLPKLADTLVEGTVTHWLKQPGEMVTEGEPLVEVETDKVNTELEAPASGVLTEIVAAEGETVPVDALLARIDAPGDQGGARAERAGAATAPQSTRPSEGAEEGAQASLSPMRRRIAERMQEVRATIDQAACAIEVPVAGLHPGAGWNAVFVKALSAAGGFSAIGVAVEVPGGLVVPVLRDLPQRDTAAIAGELRELVRQARAGDLAPDQVTGAEVTITNVGSTGTLLAFPLVSAGQPAILCPGRAEEGRLGLTLCYDRQAMAETEADELLAGVGAQLQELAA